MEIAPTGEWKAGDAMVRTLPNGGIPEILPSGDTSDKNPTTSVPVPEGLTFQEFADASIRELYGRNFAGARDAFPMVGALLPMAGDTNAKADMIKDAKTS